MSIYNKLSNKKFASYIFTDIDLIPDYDLIQYFGKKCKTLKVINFSQHLGIKKNRFWASLTHILELIELLLAHSTAYLVK